MFAKMFESLTTGDAVLFYNFDLEKNIQKETKKVCKLFANICISRLIFSIHRLFFPRVI